MNRGYVKVWRKIQDSGLMQMPKTLTLFMHILFNATHKDIKVGTSTGVIELKRGQYISGRFKLSGELNQSEREIRTSLSRLEELGIISIKTTNRYSLYTIENYGKYQDKDQQIDQQTTSERPSDDQQTTTKQELKNLRTKENTYTPEFSRFWAMWPKNERKGSKNKVKDVWVKKNLDSRVDLIIKHVNEAIRISDPKFIPAPLTYLNQERWDGWEPAELASQSFMSGVL